MLRLSEATSIGTTVPHGRGNSRVGPSYAGVHPQTTKWKSSNSSIATVSTKGDSEGGHKVTAKKKGKVTISCTVSKTGGPWVKGDVYKWIITVK